MDRIYIVLGLVFLLFNFGCTSPSIKEGGNAEIIEDYFENEKGGVISTTYIFQKQEYGEIEFRRVMNIKPKINTSKIEIEIIGGSEISYSIDDDVIDELILYLDNFNEKRSDTQKVSGEAQCKQYLGLGREEFPCDNISSCSLACVGAPICEEVFELVGEPFVKELYDLNKGFLDMDKKITETREMLISLKNKETIEKQEMEKIIHKIEEMSILGNEINQNPIIDRRVYYLCNQINYDDTELQKIFDGLKNNIQINEPEEIEIRKIIPEIEEVEYKIYVQFNENSQRGFSTILIKDELPNLNIDFSSITINSEFSKINTIDNTIEWSINKAGMGNIYGFLAYSFKAGELAEKDWIENNIKSPYLIIETLGGN